MLFRFGRFELNAARYELTREGAPVAVEPRVLELLAYLVQHRDRVISKRELLEELWSDAEVSEWALTRAVRKARAQLDDPAWIKAVYGRGYSFVAAVEEVEAQPEAPPAPSDPESKGPGQPEPVAIQPPAAAHRRSRWPLVATAIAVVALAVAVAALVRTRAAGSTPSWTPTPRVRSLAVLPLADLSSDADARYLADGMTEALITRFARLRDLRVISRTSVMRFQGSTMPVAAIARQLRVDVVLEGSVQRDHGRVRVSLALVRAADGASLWAREYDRDLGDVLALQAEIAQAVVNAVELRLSADEASRLAAAGEVDAEAYRRYLLGRFHADRRTTADLRRSVDELREAVRLDPAFAPAHAALAESYLLLSSYYGMPPGQAFPLAKEAAEEAIALAPDLAESYAARGAVDLAAAWDFAAAATAYQRALELAPGDATVHQWYGELLSVLGRHRQALAEGRRAWELDPLSPVIAAALGQRLNAAGRPRDALEQLAVALELEPALAWAHRERSYAFQRLGDGGASLEERLREMQARGVDDPELDVLRGIVAQRDQAGFWRWELGRLRHRAEDAYVPAMLLAEAEQGCGETDAAVDSLRRAISEHGDHVLQLTTSPELQALARDPRAHVMLAAVGLGHIGLDGDGGS